MTATPIELPAVADMQSTIGRLLHRMAFWVEDRHQRVATRASLAALPEHLRQDLGLDGGVRMQTWRGNGRSFDYNQHPDVILTNRSW